MKTVRLPAIAILLSSVLSLLGCSTTPSVQQPAIAEDEFRDADFDLLFATEFPVANKAEALARADTALKANDLDRAIFFYVKALRFDPEDPDLLTRIASIHRYQNHPELAVRAYSLALLADPDRVAALEGRGLILLEYDKNELAASDLAQAARLDPSAWRSQNGLGLIADQKGEHDAAIRYYSLALANSNAPGMIHNNRGYSLLLAGDSAAARKDLEIAARKYGFSQAWINLGVLHARGGDYAVAVDAFGEVLKAHEAFNKTAEIAIDNADYVAAERLLQRAISLSPTWYEDAENNLLQARLATGSSDEYPPEY